MSAPEAPTPAQDQTAPRSLKDVFGPNYPDPTAEPARKVQFVVQLHTDGETEALARYKQATRNLLYQNNRQHIMWNKTRKEWQDIPCEQGDEPVSINKIRPILRARGQRMLSPQVNFTAEPSSNADDARDRARIARNLVKERFTSIQMPQKLDAGLNLAFCTGVSALKSFWNPLIGPLTPATHMIPMSPLGPVDPNGPPPVDPQSGQPLPVQNQEFYISQDGQPLSPSTNQDGTKAPHPPETAMYKPGDTDTALRTIFNIRLNPEAHGWTQAEGLQYLIDSEVVPLAVAKQKWPELAAKLEASTGTTALTYEKIAAASATARTGSPQSTSQGSPTAQQMKDAVLVHEYWQIPDPEFFKEGRLICIVGKEAAYDGPFPDGIFPYDPIYDEPAELSPYGRPTVNDMVSPQDVINDQWTAINQEQKMAGLGQWVMWDVPGLDDQISRETGAFVKVPMRTGLTNRSISDVFQRMPGAAVSPDRWRLLDMANMALQDLGAFHEVSQGQIPPGLDSGVAIQQLLEQEAGQLRRPMDALKRTLIAWAGKQTTLAKKYYAGNVERYVPSDRPDLAFLLQGIQGEELPDPEEITFDLENWRPFSETAHRAEIKELIAAQIIPPQLGLKLLDIGRGIEAAYESETRHYVRARHENAGLEQGQIVPMEPPAGQRQGAEGQQVPPALVWGQTREPLLLPQDDNHELHMEVLDELILDPTKPIQIRQLATLHKNEHRAILQQIQQAQIDQQNQMADQQANRDAHVKEAGKSPPKGDK